MENIENSGHERTIRDQYTSLRVLTNQVWVPVSVLGRMWRLDEKLACDIAKLFCEMKPGHPIFSGGQKTTLLKKPD